MGKISTDIKQLTIDTIRVLTADAVQKANSGHPGMPMGAAPMAQVLWTEFLNFNPQHPEWPNRDRFILSAGHGCLLQYILMYFTGFDITLNDIKNFRQFNSKTPGHPEYGHLSGIEVTTGPLGQGFANAVGFAVAQKYLAARYNKPGFSLFDYTIYVICSDGDMMEGVSSEAASFAGHLKLGNLVYLYDDNHISIEGDTAITFTEDVSQRFEAYQWHVQEVEDGNDTESIIHALKNAKAETEKPSLIRIRTQIAFGSPNKAGKASAHGAPLGEDELKLVKRNFGFNPDESFVIPDAVLNYCRAIGKEGINKEKKWNELFTAYKEAYPDLAEQYLKVSHGDLPPDWKKSLPVFSPGDGMIATRKASGRVLNVIADAFPGLMGGAADLSPSTDTILEKSEAFNAGNYGGRNFHFGVREHAMGAILNGMALTAGIIPYGATFLIFSEYMRPPIRLAAIMGIKPIFIFTHDSIGLGEDGTTHQPVEQLVSLRSIPNLVVIRPADANETSHAWRVAIEHKGGPVVIILTRQGLPVIDQAKFSTAANLEKGAYILSDAVKEPDVILIGTGSEVSLLLLAQEKLKAEKIHARVISMPSWELFDRQNESYKEQVLPKQIKKRLAVEAGSVIGWHKYVTDEGDVIGMHEFGKSAPAEVLFRHFGFTVENIIAKTKALLQK